MLESVIRTSKKYHPQALLEECKYEIKKEYKKIEDRILSMMILTQVHLKMNLIMMNLMINLLKVRLYFISIKNLMTCDYILVVHY